MDPIDLMALEWLKAEREASSDTTPIARDEVAVAIDRVYQVLAGEIRWSDASPGDRHIWNGRVRDIERFDAWWRTRLHTNLSTPKVAPKHDATDRYNQVTPTPRPNPRHPGVNVPERQRVYTNLYDTVSVISDAEGVEIAPTFPGSPRSRSVRMFGNANVGCYNLTNLQHSGQMIGDWSFYVETMYVRASDWRAFAQVASSIVVNMLIGGHEPFGPPGSARGIHASELVAGIPVRQVVPPRQTFGAQLSSFGMVDEPVKTFRLRVHLEGVAFESGT